MGITDAALAVIAAEAYGPAAKLVVDDNEASVTERDGVTIVAFRGTVPSSWHDWLRDFEAWPVHDWRLGWCHRGFLDGAEDLWPLVRPVVAHKRVILTGHSLGGALAVITAGLMSASGSPPDALVTFGAPRAGGDKLRELLAPLPVRQYRNGNDPVPEVPHLYHHVRTPLIDIGAAMLDCLACHSIAEYGRLLAALATANLATPSP